MYLTKNLFRNGRNQPYPILIHRGLELDGAIGQGEICNSKVKNFENPSCPILEKIK